MSGQGSSCETISAILFEPSDSPGARQAEQELRDALERLGAGYEILHARWQRDAAGGDYARALWDAASRSTGTFLITLDGELSQDPNFIVNFWARRHTADLLIASRFDPGGVYLGPLWRRVLSRGGNAACRWLLALPYRDLTSSFRMIRREALEESREFSKAGGYGVLIEMVVLVHAAGRRVVEVPFVDFRREPGVSKGRVMQVGRALLGSLWRLWGLRHSLFSADYDDRAFSSWLPPQRWWHRRRFRRMTGLVDSLHGIVDIGCGSGKIVQSFPTAVGVDIDLRKLRFLRPHNARLVAGDLRALPFVDGAFRTAICSEVIEHIAFDERVFTELARILRPGGHLILSTPDYGRLRWRLAERIYRLVLPGGYGHEHIERYDAPRLTGCLERAGLRVVHTHHHFGAICIVKAVRQTPWAGSQPVRGA